MRLPAPGELFQNKYQIVAILGEGGMARVYRARDTESGREVALKLIFPQKRGFNENDIARLQREARVLGNLKDPHTITLYDFGRTPDALFYLVFEYIEGRDLDVIISRYGALGEVRTRRILGQILQSLREAHAAGVLHRDVKPANVLIYDYLDNRDCVKVIDFGIAKPFGNEAVVDPTLTAEGSVIGTVLYMAPEQLRGQKLSPATDVFSVGLLAYEMLTGRRGIPEDDRFDVWADFARGRSIALPPDAPVSPQLRALVDRMLRTPVAERFQSADEVLQALLALPSAESHEAAITRPQPRPAPAAFPTLREMPPGPVEPTAGGWLPLVGALAVGFAVIGAVAYAFSGDEPRRAELAPVPPAVPNEQPQVPTTPETTTPKVVVVPKATDAGEAAADSGGSDTRDDGGLPSACREGPAFAGLRLNTTVVDGTPRESIAYQPLEHTVGVAQPIVLMVHGHGRTAAQMLAYTKVLELAEEKGFVVLAPQSQGLTAWRSANDLKFLRTIVETIEDDLCVDRSRVFALGHGRGGWVVERLACEMPLAAMATTGGRGEQSCTPEPAVPYLHLEGSENPSEPVDGGRGCNPLRSVPSLQAREAEWFRRYECSGPVREYPSPKNANCITRNCETATFVSCRVDGGRDWKGAPPKVGLDCARGNPADFPYRDVIWEFFETHGTPTRPDDW